MDVDSHLAAAYYSNSIDFIPIPDPARSSAGSSSPGSLSRLEYLARSRAARQSLAENYAGLPAAADF
jgi:hypothetical protein